MPLRCSNQTGLTRRLAAPLLHCGVIHAGGHPMSGMKVLAAVLIAGGILGLVYHHFSYTKDTHEAKIGSVELSVAKKESVDVPEWAAVGAIVVGAGLLLFGGALKR